MGFHQTEIHSGCPNSVTDNTILLIVQIKRSGDVFAFPRSLTLYQPFSKFLALLQNVSKILSPLTYYNLYLLSIFQYLLKCSPIFHFVLLGLFFTPLPERTFYCTVTSFYYTRAHLLQSCLTLCDPVDCSQPCSLFMGFPRQEYWSGLPCLPPEDLLYPGLNLCLLCLLHCRQILYQWATGEAQIILLFYPKIPKGVLSPLVHPCGFIFHKINTL